MTRKLITGAALAVAPLLLAGGVQAAQITFGPSSQNVSFTGTGTGSVDVSIPALSGPALDTVTGGGGTFSFTAVSFTAGPGPGTYPVSGSPTDTFTYMNGANSVSELITWIAADDGSPSPKLRATSSVTSIAGSATFEAAFGPVGSPDTLDMTMNNIGTTLDALRLTTSTASATVSSGEDIVTPSTSTPEPASLTILGSALLGLGWLRRRRRKNV
jgi:MYXO-CTERM domain-containing protein